MFFEHENIQGSDHCRVTGLPVGAGYGFLRNSGYLDPALAPPDAQEGAETLLRVLTLRAPAGISKKALVFSDGDQRKLLGRLPDPTVSASEPSVIASCDRRKAKGHRWRLHLSILLTVGSGVNPDLLLVKGIRALFTEGTFETAKGLVLEVESYGRPRKMTPVATTLRVITRSSPGAVQQALIERGVPETMILEVIAPPSGESGLRRDVVLARLNPLFPLTGIPWKVPLLEPGFGLAPRKVCLQGAYCAICRSPDHRKAQCEQFKEQQCGRCCYPLNLLTSKGIATHLHDCEGGPAGFGTEHMDLCGSAWHQAQLASNPEPLPGAAAEVQDPLAEVRSASLLAARAAAEQAKGGAKQKRPRPPNQSGYTPDQQHQKTVEATPLVV